MDKNFYFINIYGEDSICHNLDCKWATESSSKGDKHDSWLYGTCNLNAKGDIGPTRNCNGTKRKDKQLDLPEKVLFNKNGFMDFQFSYVW